ncbi:MAG: aminoacyl-tRNA hydrolase [Pseudomonadales bacterium]|nr:aminoacyl-tRNA hydrolase [Pseudomonadales bacterium]
MSARIDAIVGLGNPGPDYAATRHNAGCWLVDRLAALAGVRLREERKFHGRHARAFWQGCEFHLLQPDTFMNRSGRAVTALLRFYQIPPSRLLLVHDELDLPPGVARFKQGGGHGGHNGLRDIIEQLGGDKSFYRLRLGIGHPGDSSRVVTYVLNPPTAAEREAIDQAMDDALRALPDALNGNWATAMSRLHAPT